MKAVILAGGLGTRIAEETSLRPKPLVEIGGKPILWHILKIYSHYGVNDFIICCGYKGYAIKEYFANYFLHMSDVTFDLSNNHMVVHTRRVKSHIGDEPFCFTYGDGVADVDIKSLINFHKSEGRHATLTAVQPPGRYGSIAFERGKVISFVEKPQGDGGWINGGFFVLDPCVIDLIDGDNCTWEREPLNILAEQGQLSAFHHNGFWQPMDTLRDKIRLEELWQSHKAPWKVWD